MPHLTRAKFMRKVRTEEVPFEFKATTSSDVIYNPARTFRYSNAWHLQADYHSSIQDAMSKDFQGNPLHILLCRLKEVKFALKSWKIDPMITHLLYADDILIMAKAAKENAECILHTFQLLKNLTGLDLNENKSTLFSVEELIISRK